MNDVGAQPSGNQQNTLISRAMRLLSQRDHSEAELRRKLAAPPFMANARFGSKSPTEPPKNPSIPPSLNR